MRLRDSANSMMCSAKVKMTGNFRVRSSGRGLEIRIGQGLSLSPIISPRSSAISKLEFAQNLKNGMIFYFKKILILRVSSPVILMSILGPIPKGIFIILAGIANYPHLKVLKVETLPTCIIRILGICKSD